MNKRLLLKLAFLCLDFFSIIFSFIIAWNLKFENKITSINTLIPNDFNILLILSLVTYLILSSVLDLLHVPRTSNRIKTSFWKYVFYPQLISIFLILTTIVFFNYDTISRLFLSLFFIFKLLFLTISKKIRTLTSQYLRISGLDLVNLAIVSTDNDISKMKTWYNKNKNSGFKFKNLDVENKNQSELIIN